MWGINPSRVAIRHGSDQRQKTKVDPDSQPKKDELEYVKMV